MEDVKLWNSQDEEMSVVHRLNNIVRYNTRNKINPETVAAHSFFTAYFVLSICKKHNIPDDIKLMALESAVLHDIHEVYVNDITYDCKQLIKGLEELISGYEANIIGQLSKTAEGVLHGENKTPSQLLANSIVKFADIMSVKQYALSETELGNSQFCEILRAAERRLVYAEINFTMCLSEFLKKEMKEG